MQHLAVGRGAVGIDVSLKSCMALGFELSTQQTNAVQFIHRLKKVRTADVESSLELVVARVFEETSVRQVSFLDLDMATLIAKHILLEYHEAHVPRIAFFVGDEL